MTYLISLAIQVAVVAAIILIVVLLTRQNRRDTPDQIESALGELRESVLALQDETRRTLASSSKHVTSCLDQLTSSLPARIRDETSRERQSDAQATPPASLAQDIARLEQHIAELKASGTAGLAPALDRLRTDLSFLSRHNQELAAAANSSITARLEQLEKTQRTIVEQLDRLENQTGDGRHPSIVNSALADQSPAERQPRSTTG